MTELGAQSDSRPDRPVRLLIVDDDPMIRLVAEERLGAAGFEVLEADGGASGIEAFASLRPDLVLLDVEMPDLSGFEVCRTIRGGAAGRDVPILIMTGLDDVDSIDRAYRVGATDFVSKPLNWAVLVHRIRYILRASASFSAVRSQQVRLDEVQEHARLGSWEVDLATGMLSASKALRGMADLGDRDGPSEARKLLERVQPDDRLRLEKAIGEAIRDRTGFSLDHRIFGHDGAERVVHSQARVCSRDDERLVLEGFTQDITERRRTEEQVRFLAYSDALTGLANRAAFKVHLASAIQRSGRTGKSLAILYLDLDHFKRVNDTFGHSAGDSLLQHVADQLVSCVREIDRLARSPSAESEAMISRLGGDEFTLLLEDLTDPGDAVKVARRVLDSIGQPVMVEGRELMITASIGIAVWPHDGANAEELLRNADSAMYHAKGLGRSNFQFYREDLNAHALEQLELETHLRRAVTEDRLVVHFQPKLAIESGRITGCEALVRWPDSPDRIVSPEDFIPLAETSGLIASIGDIVLEQACVWAKRWRDGGHPDFRMAVNLSPGQLKDDQIVETVARVLEQTGLDPQGLELEITESALIHNEGPASVVLAELRRRGIRISLDDFGTGFSSLSYLKRFPVETIKIDRSFISGIGSSSEDEAITAAILSMAGDLGLHVVAEGIETEAQLRFLTARACDEVQGYLISPALSPEDFESLLERDPPLPTTRPADRSEPGDDAPAD